MWKLATDLELWWLDLQLHGFQLSGFWIIVPLLLGIALVYVYVKIAIWRNRLNIINRQLDFAYQLINSPNLAPSPLRLRTVVLGAFAMIVVVGLVGII